MNYQPNCRICGEELVATLVKNLVGVGFPVETATVQAHNVSSNLDTDYEVYSVHCPNCGIKYHEDIVK